MPNMIYYYQKILIATETPNGFTLKYPIQEKTKQLNLIY